VTTVVVVAVVALVAYVVLRVLRGCDLFDDPPHGRPPPGS
jgi:hypothetical protein